MRTAAKTGATSPAPSGEGREVDGEGREIDGDQRESPTRLPRPRSSYQRPICLIVCCVLLVWHSSSLLGALHAPAADTHAPVAAIGFAREAISTFEAARHIRSRPHADEEESTPLVEE